MWEFNSFYQQKFHDNRSNHSRDIVIHQLFKMASICHHGLAVQVFGPLMKSIWWSLSQCRIWLESTQYFQQRAATTTTTTVLRPFLRDYPGEPVPEETLAHPPS